MALSLAVNQQGRVRRAYHGSEDIQTLPTSMRTAHPAVGLIYFVAESPETHTKYECTVIMCLFSLRKCHSGLPPYSAVFTNQIHTNQQLQNQCGSALMLL